MKKSYIEPSLYMQAIAAVLPIALSQTEEEAGEIFAPGRHERGIEEELDPEEETAVGMKDGWHGGLW